MPKDRSIFIRLFLLSVVLMGSGCAVPPDAKDANRAEVGVDSYAKARHAYRSGNYLMAAERLIPLADLGDHRAQYALGYMYYYGKGVLTDRERAVELFRSAAKQGNARAAEALKMLDETPAGSAVLEPGRESDSSRKMMVGMGENDLSKKNGAENVEQISGRIDNPPADNKQPVVIEEAAVSVDSSPPSQTAESVQRVESEVSVAPVSNSTPPTAPYTSEWLQERDPDHLTIQLVAGGEYASVQQFIATHSLQERAAIVGSRRNGEPWFVVLYGVYAGFSEAREALEALSEELKANKPWIRKLGDALKSNN